MHVRPNQRVAYDTVRYIEKTFYGRAMIIADLDEGGTAIMGYYPAVGADAVPFKVAVIEEHLNSGELLKNWVANNWHEVELAVSAARKRRYVLRSEYIKQSKED